jgi:hypothetical protein
MHMVNLRHAAALAVVGWYLMVPPVNSTGPGPWIDRSAPLSKWKAKAAFDSAAECTVARHWKRENNVTDAQKYQAAGQKIPFDLMTEGLSWDDAQCIASDDPRLK